MVKRAGLNQSQINYQVSQVRANIRHRSLLYHRDRRPVVVSGRTVIIVDDGLASGYTMRAAVTSVRHRHPEKVVVAVPVGPEHVVKEMEKVADRVVTCAVSSTPRFYVADFYRYWHDISDDEVLHCLDEWRVRRYRPTIELPERKQ
jgi:predicted phosphoribosyltransferase